VICENTENLVDSLLSREGDSPLESRAEQLRVVLIESGWT
jgi:hypothetical protein